MKKLPLFVILCLTFGLVSTFTMVSAESLSEPYEGYYLFLGDYPKQEQPGWHNEAQGITHDSNYWYITQSSFGGVTGALWKIPVSHDLSSPIYPEGTLLILTWDLEPPFDHSHYGDLDYHEHDDVGYLVIPVERDEGETPILAFFRADDLWPVGYGYLESQKNAGWCAVDPEGYIYSSNSSAKSYYKSHIPHILI